MSEGGRVILNEVLGVKDEMRFFGIFLEMTVLGLFLLLFFGNCAGA